MSNREEPKWSYVESIAVTFALLVLILAFAGEPDLWDALIKRVMP